MHSQCGFVIAKLLPFSSTLSSVVVPTSTNNYEQASGLAILNNSIFVTSRPVSICFTSLGTEGVDGFKNHWQHYCCSGSIPRLCDDRM
ncbi:hypothetical protein PGTUg99_002178 [Puccinia graminis f. sp. tritici]|uniref:Secreted protein n=1 Tax=Puccinia graminis f. sp. tritici TaxID=56615 RepID=A0A5B0QDN6_PUCGR|nr:hypothetical protein PGTUg99_002178 [Puccinia graminis f. sp. tritici]